MFSRCVLCALDLTIPSNKSISSARDKLELRAGEQLLRAFGCGERHAVEVDIGGTTGFFRGEVPLERLEFLLFQGLLAQNLALHFQFRELALFDLALGEGAGALLALSGQLGVQGLVGALRSGDAELPDDDRFLQLADREAALAEGICSGATVGAARARVPLAQMVGLGRHRAVPPALAHFLLDFCIEVGNLFEHLDAAEIDDTARKIVLWERN